VRHRDDPLLTCCVSFPLVYRWSIHRGFNWLVVAWCLQLGKGNIVDSSDSKMLRIQWVGLWIRTQGGREGPERDLDVSPLSREELDRRLIDRQVLTPGSWSNINSGPNSFSPIQPQQQHQGGHADVMPPITRPTSHKKKKRTCKESPYRSLHLEDAKRHLYLDTWSVVTPVVTQTQGEEASGSVSTDYPPPSSPLISNNFLRLQSPTIVH
jgi:hypothetical protein